jgi:hypothetical protein
MFDWDANTMPNDARQHGNFELNNSTLMRQLIASSLSDYSPIVSILRDIPSTLRTNST